VRGREIEEVYVRFTPIFAKVERVPAPQVDLGAGEELPYADGSFDLVLVWSALQFMDIHLVLREIVRVLAPGGKLIATQPLLSLLMGEFPGALMHPNDLLQKLTALSNSLSYGWFGGRLFGNARNSSTARPVYLTRGQTLAIIKKSGLRILSTIDREGGKSIILIAEKPTE
jgi:SAM-dependent methyltransferase